ncbi:alpha/beta hydrolase [Microbispora hainanensis]|jgi:pimeloyl-ACP methyl ester carboxylesterase|uniref:Alpha/beta hydrolase n=1 Tax=Microbispora hainanensis TaxID=568844 RepID=A0ABZ1SZP2_9ACTN|nr:MULTISPECIES: alpha/beta hydrolase [Microbispora]NJP26434.1 alpha/beta hydrolase [Microbispora sp. CL1-1]TQS12249.1 alpha/beta hydrolase [Microbispora sp. SCL1-1]
MARDVLLGGSSALLAARLADRLLARGAGRVTIVTPPGRPPAATGGAASADDRPRDPRLLVVDAGPTGDLPEDVRADVVWLLTGDAGPVPGRDARADAALARSVVARLPVLGAAGIVHVTADELCRPLGTSARPVDAIVACVHTTVEEEVATACAEHGIGHRLVRTVSPVGALSPAGTESGPDAVATAGVVPPGVRPGEPVPAGLHRFLAALRSVVDEVTARAPDYFGTRPLRCLVPPESVVRLTPMDEVTRVLVELVDDPATAGGRFRLAASGVVPVDGLLQRIGDVYGVRLLPVQDPAELDPIDRLLHDRLTGFLAEPSPWTGYRETTTGPREWAPPAQRALLRRVRRAQEAAEEAARDRQERVPERLVRTTIDVAGRPLTYHLAVPPAVPGPGGTPAGGGLGAEPVVLLNALGQSPAFWHPLIDRLSARRRVLVVDPRGPEDDGPASVPGLNEHADDLEAVLKNESVERCHLVGWCTGPKQAVRFAVRRPDVVASMVFLNGSFRAEGGHDGLDTPYERNLDYLCRTLVRRPEQAGRLLRLFGGEDPPASRPDEVLALTSDALREEVRAPFLSAQALVPYAFQMLAFWGDDVSAEAGQVRVPVLAVGAEHDRIVSTPRLRAAAARFPSGRFVELRGATHQCLYDRADVLAGLIEEFVADPAAMTCADATAGLAGEVDR